jgi:hypothetical protein
MKDLKERTIRGGSAGGTVLVANFLIRVGSLVALARLLNRQDRGLGGLATRISRKVARYKVHFSIEFDAFFLPAGRI